MRGVSYTLGTSKVRKLWNISTSTSMFFVETNPKVLSLPPRVMCALESAALHNPDRQVYHIAQKDIGVHEYEMVLHQYSNIQFLKRNFNDLILRSPVESIYSQTLSGTSFEVENLSDILRLMVLFFFGGVYMDTDVISLNRVPMGGFKSHHPFIYEALLNMAKDFQPEHWAYNGPDLVTRVAKIYCPAHGGTASENSVDGMWSWKCGDIQILNRTNAYAIDYRDFRNLFNTSHSTEIEAAISNSFAMHYWNKMISWHGRVTLRDDQPLYKIFRQNCPVTEEFYLRPLLNQRFHIRDKSTKMRRTIGTHSVQQRVVN
eukprot:TCALIF_01436-PA protein Name:"Similar to A4GNT Alpha-1,4-N-acetylglucosaminyltransferase (Homo sapiens)" AED:0.10 eAED:0.14 QI:50/0.5/0/1/0/0.33/3/0/315